MIILDVNKDKLCNKKLVMRVNDYPAKERLKVKILHNGKVDRWDNNYIEFYGLNSEGNKVVGGSVKKMANYIEYTFPKNSFSASGFFKRAYFKITLGDEILTTGDFEIEVINDIGINKQEAEDIISLNDEIKEAIEEAVEDIKKEAVKQQTDLKNESIKQQKELKETAQKDAEKALETSKKALEELEKIVKEQELNPGKDLEVVQARGAYKNLKDRFDNNEKTLSNKQNYKDAVFILPNQNSKNTNQKAVIKISDDKYNVISRSLYGDKKYTMMEFTRGTGDNSENSHGKNFDLLRLTAVKLYKDFLVYNQPEKFITTKNNKDKDDDFIKRVFATGYDNPKSQYYLSNTTKEAAGSFIEFEADIKISNKGDLWLAFYGTPNSNKYVEVFVDGIQKDIIDTSNSVATTVFIKVSVGGKLGKIKIKLKVSDDPEKVKAFHFLGFNANELHSIEGRSDVNGYLLNYEDDKSYISKTPGANEYAIKEKSSGKWFGSFHGGEKSESLEMFLDEVNLIDKPKNSINLGSSFKIIQKTNLIDKIVACSVTDVSCDSTYSFNCMFDIKNSFEVSDFYTCMSCSNDEFNRVIIPKDVVSSPSNNEVRLPNSGSVVQFNNKTKQSISTEYTVHNRYFTENRLRIQFFENTYAKVYHGLVSFGLMDIESINFGNKKIFN